MSPRERDLDRIADLDAHFELRAGRGDQARTDRPDPRMEERVAVPEANATRHRTGRNPPYDRSRIHLDRPQMRIHSRDFH